MKRVFAASALVLAMNAAYADPVYQPPGPNLTYGDVSNGQTIMSAITNPAAAAVGLEKGENQYRFGVLSSIGIGFEYGQVDNVTDVIDQNADAFDTSGVVITNPADVAGSADAQVKAINDTMRVVQADGYVKAMLSGHLPVMPLVVTHQGLGGSLVLDINGSIVSNARVYQDDIQFDAVALQNDMTTNPGLATYTQGDVTINGANTANPTLAVNNDTSLLVKGASTAEVALGYSRPVMDLGGGKLYGGLRAKYYQVGLARSATRLGDLTDGSQSQFEDAMKNVATASDFGLDLGVLWVGENFRLGATMNNINEPSFEFDPLDLSAYDPTRSVYTRLAASETYVMESQLKLEGAAYTSSRNWVLNASFDTNPVKDPLGDEYQWAVVSAAYASDSALIPGFRVGYRSNLGEGGLDYASLGATLFKALNLDVAFALDSAEVDGSTLPRGYMVNLGLEVTF